MGQYTLRVAGTYTFLITPETFPQIDYLWKADGSQINATEKWPLHCWFVTNDTPTLRSQWNAFLTLVQTGGPQKVEFLYDGAVVDSMDPLEYNNTPRFENIHTVNQGGGFVNHIEFTMDVVGVKAIKFGGVIDCEEAHEDTVDANGRTVRFRIRGVGNSARPFVLGRLDRAAASLGMGPPTSITYRTEPFENAFEVLAEYSPVQQSPGGGNSEEGSQPTKQWRESFTIKQPRRPVRAYGIGLNGDIPPFLVAGAHPVAELSCTGHLSMPGSAKLVNPKVNPRWPNMRDPIIAGRWDAPGFMYSFQPVSQSALGFLRKMASYAIVDEQKTGPYIEEFIGDKTPAIYGLDYSFTAIIADRSTKHDPENIIRPRF